MLTKDGGIVPEILCKKLEENGYAANVFSRMRPSCQKKYVLALSQAQNIDQKTDTIVNEIIKYGHRHKWQCVG